MGALLPLAQNAFSKGSPTLREEPLKIHVFSKHLQFLDYEDMAEAASEIGFDGVDLTVRPNGHVIPERVEQDLPKAVEAMKKAGFDPLMITTAVLDPHDPIDKLVLTTAEKLGIEFYRMNYYRYLEGKTIPESIDHFQQKGKELSDFNQSIGLVGCYQNHAGNYMGASIWELWELLKEADNDYLGAQYDIRHATVEGGLSWQNGLKLIAPFIKTLAIKDFKWVKENGSWIAQNTPIGEGMVDFSLYFKHLKELKIQVPLSLHLEYPIAGAEHGANKLSGDPRIVFEAMRKDLQKIHELWSES